MTQMHEINDEILLAGKKMKKKKDKKIPQKTWVFQVWETLYNRIM